MRARRIEWTCYLPDRPFRPCRRHHFHGYARTGSTFTAAASEPAPSPASRLLQWDCVHPADSRSIGGMHASGICVHPAGSHLIERACMHARGNCAHSAGCMSIKRACTTFVGAGLLARAVCQATTMSGGPASSRASALLQWMACIQRVRVQLGACMPVEIACIRRGCISIARACTTFVGAGLLAKAVCQARTMSGGPASSRASALLQWQCVHSDRIAAFALRH